ncbi:MAG: acyl-CoA carboxylase subunit beta, partial [Saprospiraceae bacterium]|nr:acyl-CoA carboxylase subunit beta [Saprospiraceae bacterium]
MSKIDLEKSKNEDALKTLISRMNHRLEKIKLGGGQKKIEKLHSQGKMSARERIDYLTDDDSYFLEIGAFAGFEMYRDHGGCPAGGVVAGIGLVCGRQCVIVANDATVKAGAW